MKYHHRHHRSLSLKQRLRHHHQNRRMSSRHRHHHHHRHYRHRHHHHHHRHHLHHRHHHHHHHHHHRPHHHHHHQTKTTTTPILIARVPNVLFARNGCVVVPMHGRVTSPPRAVSRTSLTMKKASFYCCLSISLMTTPCSTTSRWVTGRIYRPHHHCITYPHYRTSLWDAKRI